METGLEMTDSSQADLGYVVQFQSIELGRLVRDNKRLNERIDHLLDDIRGLRELQRRDQQLREKEQSLREKDQTQRHEAQESMRELIEMAFILPKQPGLQAPATAKRKANAKTDSAPKLAAIHAGEAPRPEALEMQQPLFSERYRNAGGDGASQAAWPEIPAFLRRTN